MEEFKILTFKEISDALNAGKEITVRGCKATFKLENDALIAREGKDGVKVINTYILAAMAGQYEARIIEPKVTLWIVIYKIGTNVYQSENIAKNDELLRREQGTWLRTVKVEV